MSRDKLRLNPDALEVESFAPFGEESTRGTVHGHSGGTYCYYSCNCANDSAPNYGSCGTTCQEPTNCYGYCTNEMCQVSNYWSCGATCTCNNPTNGGSCGCPPPPTTPEAGCPDM